MAKHVSILVPKGNISIINIAGTQQILKQVNSFLRQKKKPTLFEVELVGLFNSTADGCFSVQPEKQIRDIQKTDLIIIPAINDDPEVAVEQNRELVLWLKHHYKRGSEIACFCMATFFLASTGLLDGKQCCTHWLHAVRFRKMFPQVELLDDKIMIEDAGIYTSGAGYSYLHLLLYIVEKFAGREIADLTDRTFVIDVDKARQSPLIQSAGQKTHEDQVVKKAQDYIEINLDKKIKVDELVRNLSLSRRSLERRFKKATHNTITAYIRGVKVEAAKRNLEATPEKINEVMYGIGYSDEKSFRKTFRKLTGISPVQYRNKYKAERNSNF